MQEETFYRYLSVSKNIKKAAFENNWPYILQSTRNGLFVVEDCDSILYYTKRIKGDPLSLNVVVNYLGQDARSLVLSFADSELKKGIPTLIKNVDIQEMDFWKQAGFVETSEHWSIYSKRDDNSFPQYNISRATAINADFGKDVASQIRRFDKSRNIVTQEYTASYDIEAKQLLHDFSEYSEAKGNDYSSEVENGHLFFFDEEIKSRIRLRHIEGNELIGFSFLTPAGSVCFYNAVICRKEKNLMKYLVFQSMDFVCKNYPDIQLFGMQGSENVGQDYLKRRLNPCEIIQKTHVVKFK